MSDNKKNPSSEHNESQRIKFDKEDFDVMSVVLDLHPELKICALALKHSRKQKMSYPLKDIDQVKSLLGSEKKMETEGHQISPETIGQYLIPEDFPIESEEDLVARVHIALWRCKEDVMWSLRAPKDAQSIIKLITSKT